MPRQLVAEREVLVADQISVDKHNPLGSSPRAINDLRVPGTAGPARTWVPKAEGGN